MFIILVMKFTDSYYSDINTFNTDNSYFQEIHLFSFSS